jgi:hypothetical protein
LLPGLGNVVDGSVSLYGPLKARHRRSPLEGPQAAPVRFRCPQRLGARLLLDHRGPGTQHVAWRYIARLQTDDVAGPKFRVEHAIKERKIPDTPGRLKLLADRPDVFWLERRLGTGGLVLGGRKLLLRRLPKPAPTATPSAQSAAAKRPPLIIASPRVEVVSQAAPSQSLRTAGKTDRRVKDARSAPRDRRSSFPYPTPALFEVEARYVAIRLPVMWGWESNPRR